MDKASSKLRPRPPRSQRLTVMTASLPSRAFGSGRSRHDALAPFDHLELLKHVVDEGHLATDAQDVGHLDLLGVRASRVDGKVAGAESEQPVPEKVVPVPDDLHSAG